MKVSCQFTNNELLVKKVTVTSPEYAESLRLRDKILREPLGLRISERQVHNEQEENYAHYILKNHNGIIAAVSIKENPKSYQITQIATLSEFQGQGFGKLLLDCAENNCVNADKKFTVYSRVEAIGFYIKCSYVLFNDELYNFHGIEHRLMVKNCF